MAELQDRRRRVVDLLAPNRQLRVETIVRLMSLQIRSRKTLVAAGFVTHIVTDASAKAGRRVGRQQCGLVFVNGLIAKVELNVAVSVLAAQLIPQLRQERLTDRIAADALRRFVIGRRSAGIWRSENRLIYGPRRSRPMQRNGVTKAVI